MSEAVIFLKKKASCDGMGSSRSLVLGRGADRGVQRIRDNQPPLPTILMYSRV